MIMDGEEKVDRLTRKGKNSELGRRKEE